MKRFYIYILLITFTGFAACSDWIDVQPEDSTTFTNYFKNKKDAEALLTNLQFGVRSVMGQTNWQYNGFIADTVKDNALRQIRSHTPAQYVSSWESHYLALTYADIIIDNAHRFPLTEEEIKPYVMQAYFARAVIYFTLARTFGDVPIRKNTVAYEKLPQSPVTEVLEYATQSALKSLDLQKFEDLRDDNGDPRTIKQYASKGAAAALLAHIYAWRAEFEKKPEFWAEAEKYCTMIINGEAGYYKLTDSVKDICKTILVRNSTESIWEIYRTTTESKDVAYLGEQFMNYPVRYDKTPQTTDNMEIYKSTINEMYDKDDHRRNAYFFGVDADTMYTVKDGAGVVSYVLSEMKNGKRIYKGWNNTTQEEYDASGMMNNQITAKFILDTDPRFKKAFLSKFRYPFYTYNASAKRDVYQMMNINRVIWRLADIHLLRAECRARQNNPNAAEDLNIIRKRAYGNSSHDYQASEGDIRMAIFREREKELIFEGHRYYDVLRNGYLHNEDVRMPDAFRRLTEQDIRDGALFFAVGTAAFANNDLIRQNSYWNRINN